jgi:hypothetical protein
MPFSDKHAGLLMQLVRIWRGNYLGKAGIACIGLATLTLSPNVLLLAAALLAGTPLREALAQNNASLGQYLFAVCCLGFAAYFLRSYVKHGKPPTKSAVIAVRHQSFDGNTHPLSDADMPSSHQGSLLLAVEIDQTEFTRNGQMLDPEAALRKQLSLASQLKTHLSSVKDATLAYYGKAHIPLAFAAGFSAQSDTPLLLYELVRGTSGWRQIDELSAGDDLGVVVEDAGQLVRDGIAVIRISVSYEVGKAEVDERLPQPYADFHLRVREPKIDIVTSRHQVETIAEAFRSLVDRLRNSPNAPSQIHVFCSAPMSVVFSLGRRISPTLHPAILVHNYNLASTPRYAWSIQLTGVPEPRAAVAESQPA